MSQAFKKVLVANRGEIAMRIFRACHDLGLQTVAIYSNEDVYSLFRTAADESYLIGENESPLGAYLDIPRIIELAKKHGADAIHPGYGFLSENADFARACEAAGIKFIGPSSQVLDLMGDKLSAKQIAVACGVPTTPGTTEPLKSREAAQKLAMEFGFPVILKAAAGGGGRGMRRCDTVTTSSWRSSWWSPSTSKCRYWAMSRAMWSTCLSGTAPSSGATRRWWSSLPPSPWTRRSARPCMTTR